MVLWLTLPFLTPQIKIRRGTYIPHRICLFFLSVSGSILVPIIYCPLSWSSLYVGEAVSVNHFHNSPQPVLSQNWARVNTVFKLEEAVHIPCDYQITAEFWE